MKSEELYMKNILKNKKVIILIILILIILIALGIYFIFFKEDGNLKNKREKEELFTAYVKINPLVKFTFKANYYECTNEKKTEICGDYQTTIENVEFLNDEAKEVYANANTNFKEKAFEEGITLLASIAYENQINIDKISITTNWNYKLEEIEKKILDNLKLDTEVNIIFTFQEEFNEEEIIEKNTTKKYTIAFDTDGGTSIESQIVKGNETITKPADPTKANYTFAGWTLDGSDFDFTTPVTSDLTLKAKWNKNESTNQNQTPSGNTNTSETKKPTESTNNSSTLGANEYYSVKDGKIHKYTFTFTEKEACEKGGDAVAYDTVFPVKPYVVFGCDEIKDANGNILWGVYYLETTNENSKFYY